MKKIFKYILRLLYFFPFGKQFLLRIVLEDEEKTLLDFKKAGFFVDNGWFHSLKLKMPVDKFNSPLPWLTYSCIDFLIPRINNQVNLLEYGSGNSTLFFAKRVNHVTSIEHNHDWFKKMQKTKSKNIDIYHKDIEEMVYATFPLSLKKEFDIILIDGRDRNICCVYATKLCSKIGIIILDDTHRDRYNEGRNQLKKSGYREIEFWGIAPGDYGKKCTSLFYRNNNILKI